MVHNNMNMDMDVNTSRGRSINSSIDELSAHSSLSSIFYIERMEAQSNNLSWANQVDKFDKYQRLSLFYWDQENNKITNEEVSYANVLNSNGEGVNNTDMNMCTLWDLGAPPAL